MSAPVGDDENSNHQMYAPKSLREHTRIPRAPQLRDSPRISPSQPQGDRQEEYGLSYSEGDLENEVRRRLYEREAVPLPQRRRGYSVLMLISGLAIGAAFAMLIVMFATNTNPIWQGTGAQRDASSEVSQAVKVMDQPATNRAATDAVVEIAATSGTQQPSSGQAQPQPTQPAPLAPQFEQNAVQGVTENEIRFGISAPFSGPAKELGQNMKLGIEAAFNVTNAKGGVHGRQLRLVVADDGYEPSRTAETMKQLYEQDRVFGMVGNVGTPTAVVALPYALERRMLFYGAFTGAGLLRRDPPDRYVFNYRASYAEETEAVVRYLVKVRRLKPEQIAVFAQQDSYGDAGFAGVAKAVRSLQGGNESTILRLNYKRNTVDVDEAVAQLQKTRSPIKAVIMVPTYRAAAKFIEKTRGLYPNMIYTSVSFVGSTALANELMLLGQKYATGVIVTQVVPAVEGHSSVVLDYKSALAKYFPGEAPDYVSLEGYLAGGVLVEALRRNGPQLDTERLVDALENLRDFDLGLGTPVTFGRTEHQALHKVWGTELNATGHYQPIDLE
jgi:branched-chain amino acid transport system substrate-binding protein